MRLEMLPVCMDQTMLSNYAIQTSICSDLTSTNLFGKFTRLPCRLYMIRAGFRDLNFQSSARQKGNLVPGFIVFAIPNENNEIEGGSQACSDDLMLASLGNHGSSEEPCKQDAALTSCSEAEATEGGEFVGSHDNLLDKLKAVHLHVLALEQWNAPQIKLCHRNYSASAVNLIHYLALRSLDIEQLKYNLSSIGLLNLESINPHVLASLSAGIRLLESLKSYSLNSKVSGDNGISAWKSLGKQTNGDFTIDTMRKNSTSNKELLLGRPPDGRATHIMVTVGQEAIASETLITNLLKSGTTIVRINCAHGNPSIWSEIIRRVRRSSQMLEKPCRVIMDLAGPKLRTGNLKAGPCVMKISPKKCPSGFVISPAQVWLSPKGAGPPPAHLSPDAVLCIEGQEFLSKLELGDTIRFCDARGKQKTLKISKKFPVFSGVGCMAECMRTAYVQSGAKLSIRRKKEKSLVGFVIDVPSVEQFVRVKVGDLLVISRDGSDGQDESTGASTTAHRVTCSSGYLFDSVKPGEPIAFDDGKIWGVVQGTGISEIIVSITHASPKGTKLGSEKSINIPESDIRFEGLTSKDLLDLDFVATHADTVGVSFVRDVRDIVVLRQELQKRKLKNLGIVLKIETRGGFEKLPLMLLEAMKAPNPLGVMIARGDLAVECGWESLAVIQEEILSICIAAHVPVIWATQVLESLVKSGVPTRAEITDVAAGGRASCIMLNKGRHILDAVSTLDTLLHCKSGKVKANLKPLVLSSDLF